ncbi:MAG TPA: hypothetical protein VNV62_03095 [Trebonia sp.]|jgi:hypothetical protein|nr:hypothetical protein [Trebonia sp.]
MNPLGNCPGCGGDEPFEQIHTGGCPDTDGGECPEWMCTVCGAGVIMGTVPSALAGSARADEADAARQHPRAA